MALVSAHGYGARYGRAGATEAELFEDALSVGADFIEFDIQRTSDGVFVVLHDHHVEVGGVRTAVASLTLAQLRGAGVDLLTYAEALDLVRGKARAHLDFKYAAPASTYQGSDEDTWEVQATAQAIDALGADHVVVTTGRDRGVAVVRRWAMTRYPDLLVGLSLGGWHTGLSVRRRLTRYWSEFFPARRMAACDANVVAANKWLARFGVARWAHRAGVQLLVWTVDDQRGLRSWLSDPRCWLVTTNRVHEAVRIRDGYLD